MKNQVCVLLQLPYIPLGAPKFPHKEVNQAAFRGTEDKARETKPALRLHSLSFLLFLPSSFLLPILSSESPGTSALQDGNYLHTPCHAETHKQYPKSGLVLRCSQQSNSLERIPRHFQIRRIVQVTIKCLYIVSSDLFNTSSCYRKAGRKKPRPQEHRQKVGCRNPLSFRRKFNSWRMRNKSKIIYGMNLKHGEMIFLQSLPLFPRSHQTVKKALPPQN